MVLGAALGVVTACERGDDAAASDVTAFCAQAVAQQAWIVSPPVGTEAELQASLDFYRLMGQLAPIAIAEEWAVLVGAMETASTVVPGDAASEQLAAMTAYATEPSAYRIKVWLQQYCGLDLPITTIAPQAAEPPRPTTIAGGTAALVPPGTLPSDGTTP